MKNALFYIAFFGALFFSNIGLTIILPFYPLLSEEKGVSEWILGFIFASLPISNLITIPIVTKYVRFFGFKLALTLGHLLAVMFIQCISVFLMGVAPSQEYTAFIIVSFVFRILSGISDALVDTGGLPLIVHKFPGNVDAHIAAMEIVSGIGMVLGPVIISVLGYFIDLPIVFYSLFVLMVVLLPLVYWTVPELKAEPTERNKGVKTLLKNKDVLLDYSMLFLLALLFFYLDPYLSLYIHYKGYKEYFIGIGFTILSACYMLTNLLLIFVSQKFSCYFWMAACGVLNTAGIFLLGAVEYIAEENLYGIYTGLILVGTGSSFGYVMTIPSILRAVEKDDKAQDNINEAIAGILGVVYTVAQMVGPLLGSNLVGAVGDKLSGAIITCISLVFSTLYFTFRSRKQYQELLKVPV